MIKIKTPVYLTLIALILLMIPTILPLTKNGFFTMHDDQQIVRLIQLDKSLKAGIFPVRWVQDLGFGYGYPLFNFYPPFVYYLGEIYYLFFNLSYIEAIKLVFATSFAASGITMFFWIKDKFGSFSGLIAGLFYVYAPYRAVDAYVRGALAEAFSFVWLPMILLCIDKIFEKVQSKWLVGLSVSYAFLMITHNLIVLPFTLIMGLYVVLKLLSLEKKDILKVIVSLIFAGFVGLSLSAFFWIPAISEKQFTLVDNILLNERYDHSLHYVAWTQLWNSIWGYGGSSPDLLDGFTLKIGKIHILVSLITLIIAIFLKVKKFQKIKILSNDHFSQILILFSLLIFSSWMTTKNSSIVWDNFSPIQFLQFPWRFLSFTTLFSSALSGAFIFIFIKLIEIVSQKLKLKFIKKPLLLGVLVLVILGLLVPNQKLFNPQTFLNVDDSYYQDEEFTKWHISNTSFEFVPKNVATTKNNELGITQLKISKEQIAKNLIENSKNGEVEVEIIKDLPHKKILKVNAKTLSQIQFNIFDFPGWKLYLNGDLHTINSNNELKLISTFVPEGEHNLELIFENTPIRKVANLISLITLSTIGIYLSMYKKFKPFSS